MEVPLPFGYDAEGNRTARFVDTNANGLLDTGDTSVTLYTWDHRNRLNSVTERATAGGTVASHVECVTTPSAALRPSSAWRRG